LERLDVIAVIDKVVGIRRSDAGASRGSYLALAALNRVVAPRSNRAFADWRNSTAADRFTKITPAMLDHRRFSDAMHTVTLEQLAEIEQQLALRIIEVFDLDISALALDMTNFATYIGSGNAKAPIGQRGEAKQKRASPAPGWCWVWS
jgi:transposase